MDIFAAVQHDTHVSSNFCQEFGFSPPFAMGFFLRATGGARNLGQRVVHISLTITH